MAFCWRTDRDPLLDVYLVTRTTVIKFNSDQRFVLFISITPMCLIIQIVFCSFYSLHVLRFEIIFNVLLDFSLTVKAATLIFISGCGSAISSAKEGKSDFVYNLVKSKKLFEPLKCACIS